MIKVLLTLGLQDGGARGTLLVNGYTRYRMIVHVILNLTCMYTVCSMTAHVITKLSYVYTECMNHLDS